MFFSYFDESGDDGFPKYSSQLFVLTSIYFHYSFWRSNYDILHNFRKELKLKYNFPIKQEFHTSEFINDKNPYHGKYSHQQRREILFECFGIIPLLKLKIVNVVIDKGNITYGTYDVLENCLKYNVQRIENDLNSPRILKLIKNPKFIILTDEGRLSKMRRTVRAMQKINYIPSKIYKDSYRKEIKGLIEDVLPKKSQDSYFIQLADMIAFVVSLYVKENRCKTKLTWSNRTLAVLKHGDEIQLLDLIKEKLNLDASANDRFGIVYYPK